MSLVMGMGFISVPAFGMLWMSLLTVTLRAQSDYVSVAQGSRKNILSSRAMHLPFYELFLLYPNLTLQVSDSPLLMFDYKLGMKIRTVATG